MRPFISAAITAIVFGLGSLTAFSGCAYAQSAAVNLWDDDKHLTSAEKEKQKEIDDAYNGRKGKDYVKKSSSDPWGSVRGSASAPSATSKSRQSVK